MPKATKTPKEPEAEQAELPKPAVAKKKKHPSEESNKSKPVEQPSSEDEAVEEELEDDEQYAEEFEGEEDEEQQVAEQPEEEQEEQEEEQEDPAAARKKRMVRNRKAKLVGYRNLAKAAGYSDRYGDDVMGSAGLDGQACLFSMADAVRCTRFVPATPSATTFGLEEFAERHKLSAKSVPLSAARESQVHLDLVLRSTMNKCGIALMEAGKKTISASIMQSVLREPAANMLFTAVVPPLGLVRYGQQKGLLSCTEADSLKKAGEKAVANKNKRMVAEHAKAEEERLSAVRKARKVREEEKAAIAA